jgi:hypothetical protein
LTKTANILIERSKASRVEAVMSRARSIVVSVIPALVLLASLDCIAGSLSPGGAGPSYLAPAPGHNKHKEPPADTSLAQAVQRWNRRLSAQPGHDGFAGPDALALPHTALPHPALHALALSSENLGLAQCWQFRLRAASEPRAPTLVS